jgi:hypothetical protein
MDVTYALLWISHKSLFGENLMLNLLVCLFACLLVCLLLFVCLCLFISIFRTGFLPPHHPGGRVHVRSTDVDRCLNSVHSLLDALYPHILIPVHTIPQEQEKLLQPTDKCPSFLVSYRPTLHQMDDIAEKRFNTAKSNILPRLKNITGWGDTLLAANLLTIATDNIICAEAHNLHIPEELEQLKETVFGFTKFIYYHKFVARLVSHTAQWSSSNTSEVQSSSRLILCSHF